MTARLAALVASATLLMPAHAPWVGAAVAADPPCPLPSLETAAGSGICEVTFDASTTWTVPGGVTSLDLVVVGGGGAGGYSSDLFTAGGGGGGGQVKVAVAQPVTPGEVATITVGAGGKGHDTWTGDDGETSQFSATAFTVTSWHGYGGNNGMTVPVDTYAFGGDGGDSGSGQSGGRASWNFGSTSKSSLVGGGGGGNAGAGHDAQGTAGGAGGSGTTPTAGLFAGQTTGFGGGGGGGSTYPGEYGSGPATDGGGVGGGPSRSADDGVANTGGGGGGGAGGGVGKGGSGVVIVRFVNPAALPTVVTGPAGTATASTATTPGQVVSDGGVSPVTERGVVYAPTAADTTPRIGDAGVAKVADASAGTGTFSVGLTGLTAATSYSYAAYATNSLGTSYGSVETFATAAKAAQSITWTSTAPTGATVGDSGYTPTATATSGLGVTITVDASSATACSISAGVVSFLAVGTCVVDANQPGSGEYLAAPQAQQSITVEAPAPTPLTAKVTVAPKTYDGTTTATITGCTLAPDAGATVGCDWSDASARFSDPTAGSHSVSATGLKLSGTGTAAYAFDGTGTGSGSIGQASSTTVVTCPAGPYAYTGLAQTPCAVAVTGAGGLSLSPDPAYTGNVAPGTATASYTYAGDANHTGSSDSATFAIGQATATCHVTGGAWTYDGTAHGASGSCTGLGGAALAGLSLGDSFTGVPGGTARWTFSNPDYASQSGDVAIEIAPAPVTITAGSYSGTYDGASHVPTACAVSGAYTGALSCANDPSSVGPAASSGTISPVLALNGEDRADFSVTSVAGSYAIGARPLTATLVVPYKDYDGTTAVPLYYCQLSGVVGTDDVSCDTAGATAAYDSANAGTMRTATATGLRLAGAAAGDYSFGGTATGTGQIGQLRLRVAASHDPIAYGDPAPAGFAVAYSGLLAGETAATALSGAPACAAYTAPFKATSTPYAAGSRPGPYAIACTIGTLASANYEFVSSGGTLWGGGLPLSASLPVQAGMLTVQPATPSCTVTPYSVTYDGSAHTASGSCTGVGGATLPAADLALAGTAHTNAGTYASDPWSFHDPTGNYADASGSVADAIGQADSTTVVNCPAGPYTYTGSAQTPCTVSVTGAGGLGLTPTPAYAGNLNAGTATASYAYAGDANHTGSSDSETFTIGRATPTCTVTPYSVTFDTAAHTATGSCTGVGGATDVLSGLDLSQTTHTKAATYTDGWTFLDATGNYNVASGTLSDTIDQATATVTYSGPTYVVITSGSTVAVNLAATVSPSLCGTATYAVTPLGGTTLPGSGPGFTLGAGMYDIVASVGGAGANCSLASDEAVLSVVSPGDTANGGGWYKVTTIQTGSPRVNFGFTVQKTTKSIKGSTNLTVAYSGGLLWLNNGQWRLKAKISTSTVVSSAGAYVSGDALPYGSFPCPTSFTSTLPAGSAGVNCASLRGAGTLEQWSLTANGGLGGWVASTYGTVSFTATIWDGGQTKVCKTAGKTTCSTVSNPDWFGIQVDPVPSSVIRESDPVILSGGSAKAG